MTAFLSSTYLPRKPTSRVAQDTSLRTSFKTLHFCRNKYNRSSTEPSAEGRKTVKTQSEAPSFHMALQQKYIASVLGHSAYHMHVPVLGKYSSREGNAPATKPAKTSQNEAFAGFPGGSALLDCATFSGSELDLPSGLNTALVAPSLSAASGDSSTVILANTSSYPFKRDYFRAYLARHIEDPSHLETLAEGSCPFVQGEENNIVSFTRTAPKTTNSETCMRV